MRAPARGRAERRYHRRMGPSGGARDARLGSDCDVMTDLELELAALRRHRRSPGMGVWLRRFAPFDRRAIRDPDERDAYWVTVQQRLAESDAQYLMNSRATEPPARVDRPLLIGG